MTQVIFNTFHTGTGIFSRFCERLENTFWICDVRLGWPSLAAHGGNMSRPGCFNRLINIDWCFTFHEQCRGVFLHDSVKMCVSSAKYKRKKSLTMSLFKISLSIFWGLFLDLFFLSLALFPLQLGYFGYFKPILIFLWCLNQASWGESCIGCCEWRVMNGVWMGSNHHHWWHLIGN